MSDKPKAEFRHQLTVTGVLTLTEAEMGALEALAGYGADPFIETFYKHMGKHYLQPYEAGLRSLFATISATVPAAIRDVNDARKALQKSREDSLARLNERRPAPSQETIQK